MASDREHLGTPFCVLRFQFQSRSEFRQASLVMRCVLTLRMRITDWALETVCAAPAGIFSGGLMAGIVICTGSELKSLAASSGSPAAPVEAAHHTIVARARLSSTKSEHTAARVLVRALDNREEDVCLVAR